MKALSTLFSCVLSHFSHECIGNSLMVFLFSLSVASNQFSFLTGSLALDPLLQREKH